MGSSYSGQNTAGTMDSHLLVVLPASVLPKRASGRASTRTSWVGSKDESTERREAARRALNDREHDDEPTRSLVRSTNT